MARRESRTTAKVIDKVLYTVDEATTGLTVGSSAWFTWLAQQPTAFTSRALPDPSPAIKERRQRGGDYWPAYRRSGGTLHWRYLGKTDGLTYQLLSDTAASMWSTVDSSAHAIPAPPCRTT